MRILKQELYFPLIIGIHFLMWAIDLTWLYDGPFLEAQSDTMLFGEYENTAGVNPHRVVGEVFSSWVVTVFAFNFLMATRARWVERIFGGLDKMYLIHRRSGVIAVVLLLAHFVTVPRDLTAFNVGKPLGFCSMILIFLGVVISAAPPLKRRIPYHIWNRIHRLMGLFYVAGVAHSFLVFNLIRELPLTRTYVFGMAALGVGSWFYRAFLYRISNPEFEYTVEEKRDLDGGVHEFLLRPKAAALKFRAGQFAFFRFPEFKGSEQHPFTISSHPDAELLRVTIKGLGDFTKALPEAVKVGDPVKLEGPFGHFTRDAVKGDEQVWIAGGIGITPFLSLARDSNNQRVHLYWSVNGPAEAAYQAELEEIAEANPDFEFTLWDSNASGYLTTIALGADLSSKSFLLCGPAPLKDAITKQLGSAGVSRSAIFDEEFAFR